MNILSIHRRLVVSNANPSMFDVTKRWGSCLTTSLQKHLMAEPIA